MATAVRPSPAVGETQTQQQQQQAAAVNEHGLNRLNCCTVSSHCPLHKNYLPTLAYTVYFIISIISAHSN